MKDAKIDLPSFLQKQQVKAHHWSKRWWAQILQVALMTGAFGLVLYVFWLTFSPYILYIFFSR